MTPTHATKGTRRYRYYVSRIENGDSHRPWRLPAHAFERLVVERLARLVGQGSALADRLRAPSAETSELLRQRSSDLAERLTASASNAADLLHELGAAVQVHDDRVLLRLDARALLDRVLGADARWLAVEIVDESPLELVLPVRLRRRGQELRLVFPPGDSAAPAQVDAKLVELLAKAQQARDTLLGEQSAVPPAERPHLTRLARLSYLAPDIVAAIMNGRQPAHLSARQLLRAANLPSCWQAQRQMLGVD